MPRLAVYHPPRPLYKESEYLNYVVSAVEQLMDHFPNASISLLGDFHSLTDPAITERTGLKCIVSHSQPTRGPNILDRIFASDESYSNVKVVKSTVKSDHLAIVANDGFLVKGLAFEKKRKN